MKYFIDFFGSPIIRSWDNLPKYTEKKSEIYLINIRAGINHSNIYRELDTSKNPFNLYKRKVLAHSNIENN